MNDKGSIAYENVPEKDVDLVVNTRIQDEKNAKRDMLGFILGVIASASLAVGVGCVQALQGTIPHFEINAMRFIFIFLVTSASFLVRREPPKIPRGDIIYVTMYAVMGERLQFNTVCICRIHTVRSRWECNKDRCYGDGSTTSQDISRRKRNYP